MDGRAAGQGVGAVLPRVRTPWGAPRFEKADLQVVEAEAGVPLEKLDEGAEHKVSVHNIVAACLLLGGFLLCGIDADQEALDA